MYCGQKEARLAGSFAHGQQDGQSCRSGRDGALPPVGNCSSLGKQSDSSFTITLDDAFYMTKPQTKEYAVITKRLQLAGPVVCTLAEFCDHVKNGGSWVGATYQPSDYGWGGFIGQQVFGLDFDNAATRDGVKVPLKPGDDGFLDPVDALIRCEALGLPPLCLYFTQRAQCPGWPRFRLVFDMGKLVDEDAAEGVIETLLEFFPEADQACRNKNRIFLGSQGEVWEAWRVWGGDHDD